MLAMTKTVATHKNPESGVEYEVFTNCVGDKTEYGYVLLRKTGERRTCIGGSYARYKTLRGVLRAIENDPVYVNRVKI